MKTFFLFRHGETDWNRAGKMQGWSNQPLNKLGCEQAEALDRFLKDSPLMPWGSLSKPLSYSVLSSHLDRAKRTAEIAFSVVRGQEPTVLVDPRLAETNLGQAESLTRSEIERKFGAESWAAWVGLSESSWLARFPDGESKGEVRDRALSVIHELALKDGPSVVFLSTHGGWLRRLIHHFYPNHSQPIDVPNCSIFQMIVQTRNGEIEIQIERDPIFAPPIQS